MAQNQIGPGKNAPEIIDVIIEISPAEGPVKYEVCKDSNRLRVDRFLKTAMYYPCHYGYIPSTLSDDGDPCDVLVLTPHNIMPGSIISVRPLGMLVMEDEAGLDNKILAVPSDDITSEYHSVKSLDDLSSGVLDKLEHFFTHYKDLDSDKWVKIKEWQGYDEAIADIKSSIANASQ